MDLFHLIFAVFLEFFESKSSQNGRIFKKKCPSCQKHGILIMAGLHRWDSVAISPYTP